MAEFICKVLLRCDEIATLLRKKGLSLTRLATATDLHPRTISRVLKKGDRADFQTAKKIAEALGVEDLDQIIQPSIQISHDEAENPCPLPVEQITNEQMVPIVIPIPKSLFRQPRDVIVLLEAIAQIINLQGSITSTDPKEGSLVISIYFSLREDLNTFVIKFVEDRFNCIGIGQIRVFHTIPVEALIRQLYHPVLVKISDDARILTIEDRSAARIVRPIVDGRKIDDYWTLSTDLLDYTDEFLEMQWRTHIHTSTSKYDYPSNLPPL